MSAVEGQPQPRPTAPGPEPPEPAAGWHAAVRRLWRRTPELCALYPLLWYGLAHQLAWSASLELGRWPIPSRDDPKFIPGLVPAQHTVLMLLLTLWPVLALLGLLATLGQAAERALRGRAPGTSSPLAIGLRALLLLATQIGFVVLARTDPGGVVAWLFD